MSRNLGCITVLSILSVPCLAVLAIGVKIGLAFDYTYSDWLSLLVPDLSEPGALSRWLMVLPVVGVPLLTLGLIVAELVRPRR